jgi:hypothetical protein
MRRGFRRLVMRYFKQAVGLVVLEALLFTAIAFVGATSALAGDSYPTAGNGDCWRGGFPEMCRTTWAGQGSRIHMRIIDQLGDGTLHNDAGTACNNWNSAPGPQFCSYGAGSNDTFTYLKINDGLSAPDGVTFNCVNGACPTSGNAGNIQWSEINVPHANTQFGGISISVFAHEIGHAYGLAHHGPAGSNQAVMTQGTTRQGPNSIDIGPFPGCSGGAGTGGVRCIYQDT